MFASEFKSFTTPNLVVGTILTIPAIDILIYFLAFHPSGCPPPSCFSRWTYEPDFCFRVYYTVRTDVSYETLLKRRIVTEKKTPLGVSVRPRWGRFEAQGMPCVSIFYSVHIFRSATPVHWQWPATVGRRIFSGSKIGGLLTRLYISLNYLSSLRYISLLIINMYGNPKHYLSDISFYNNYYGPLISYL